MARVTLCDFCLEEKGTFLRRLQSVPGGYYICRDCRKKLESYDLSPRYDLFQQLVIADPSMREMMMRSYLEDHDANDALGKFYPSGTMMLHRGEALISCVPATTRVVKSSIPEGKAVTEITEVQKKDLINLPYTNNTDDYEVVSGTLYETNAAIYFFSEHFLNVHRITNLINDSRNAEDIQVLERNQIFRYQVEHPDLFLMRHRFYHILVSARSKKKENLVYLTSENTMTLTPGIYSVPKNINPGSYWLSSVSGDGVSIRDNNGHVQEVKDGHINLYEGSMLECTGEYQLRIRKHDDPVLERVPQPNEQEEVTPTYEKAPSFEEVTQEFKVINE